MTNAVLASAVAAEIAWDPRIDGETVEVSAGDGVVTLRGWVGSYRQKREARRAAERVRGVTYVDNDLDIRVPHPRTDTELRGDVLMALTLDDLVPDTVTAHVTAAVVRLVGTAGWHHERSEAELVAGNVRGVVGVENDIYLTTPVAYAGDVRAAIVRALERDARVEARTVGVRTLNGTVVLTGSVRSWAARESAVSAAWSAPGVNRVDDRLEISY